MCYVDRHNFRNVNTNVSLSGFVDGLVVHFSPKQKVFMVLLIKAPNILREIQSVLLLYEKKCWSEVSPNPLALNFQTPHPQKILLEWVFIIGYFFNFGDKTLIQNVKNIRSKFLIDVIFQSTLGQLQNLLL